jgi:hypothetical protein
LHKVKNPGVAGAADEVKNHHSVMIVGDVKMLLDGECPARLVNPQVL